MFDMNSQRVITHIKREPGKYVELSDQFLIILTLPFSTQE